MNKNGSTDADLKQTSDDSPGALTIIFAFSLIACCLGFLYCIYSKASGRYEGGEIDTSRKVKDGGYINI